MYEAADPVGASTPAAQLAAYLAAIRRRWLPILLFTVITAGIAFAVSSSATKQYDATAKVLLDRSNAGGLLESDSPRESADPEREINTDIELTRLETVAERARSRLGLSTSAEDVLDQVRSRVEGDSNLIAITARDSDPRQAARIANAFAEEYVSFRRRSAQASIAQAARLARERLASLSAEDRASLQGRQLEARLRELEIAAVLQTGGVEVVRRAPVPTAAATPRPRLTMMLAGLAALALAVGGALLVELTDRRLKDEDSVEAALGLPILAAIPAPQRRRPGARGDGAGQAEGYATLATSLRFLNLGSQPSVLLVTSAGRGEGKTHVTLGLVRGLAGLGRRALAIEADLREPGFARLVDVSGTGGLTSVLVGTRSLDGELLELGAAGQQPAGGQPVDQEGHAWVLPAGPLPPNPQAILSTQAMAALVGAARDHADFVLLDTPPVGPVNDWLTLAHLVDGVLFVVRLRDTTRDAARRALRAMRDIDVQVLGVVVTNAPPPLGRYQAEGHAYAPGRPPASPDVVGSA